MTVTELSAHAAARTVDCKTPGCDREAAWTGGSYVKDGVENRLRAAVCAGRVTLAAARRVMRSDWRTGR